MPRKKLSPKAPCPCGSGKKYGRCCHGKDFEYLVDQDGNIFKSIPMTDELAEVIEDQKRKFFEKFGREPRNGDNLFFDMPPLEHAEHFMVEAMKQAGLDPAIVYAFEKTGLLVIEANEHLISDKDRAEWETAVKECLCCRPVAEGDGLWYGVGRRLLWATDDRQGTEDC